MFAIRDLLDFLADSDADSIDRLCDLRGVSGRGSSARCESLARSYRGDHAQLFEDLRKQDLVSLLADPTEIDGVDRYLTSANRYTKEELADMALTLFWDEEVPEEFVLGYSDDEE